MWMNLTFIYRLLLFQFQDLFFIYFYIVIIIIKIIE